MKLNIPPTLQPLDLGDWNLEAKGQVIHIWVDPPQDVLRKRDAFRREYIDFMAGLLQKPEVPAGKIKLAAKAVWEKKLQEKKQHLERIEEFIKSWNPKVHTWYAELWSHGPEGTHWTVDELDVLRLDNPNLLNWLIARSNEMLDGYRGAEKKG
jgi:hypothetical protein